MGCFAMRQAEAEQEARLAADLQRPREVIHAAIHAALRDGVADTVEGALAFVRLTLPAATEYRQPLERDVFRASLERSAGAGPMPVRRPTPKQETDR